MMSLWGLFIKLLRPHIGRIEDLPPLPDPAPGPDYHQAMAEARAARERAERILATYSESKPSSTSPA